MAEPASTVVREAKNIHHSLKDALKKAEPYDKEVDFQRKNLRRRYLLLLLVHPYSPDTKDAETHLWMQTSYAFIAVYKQRIATLDRAQTGARGQPQPKHPSGPVEYRKLLQRFRQFLADEEKFWTQLVVRYCRSFALEEAQPTLITLGILSAGIDGKVLDETDGSPNNSRNHYQFPSPDLSVDILPTSPADRASRLAILSKALICLGDIARYREQYNEAGGRPKAGHEDVLGHAKRGRNRRGSYMEGLPRPRNYERARQCYEQARLLVPDEGNPSHQLAILASYQKDPFASLVHYYRALCVRQPYDTAAENMGSVMNKALDQWKRKDVAVRDPPVTAVPKIRIDALKEKVVVLNAIWRLGLEKMEGLSIKLSKAIYSEFNLLVSERHIPENDISDFIILSQGTIWKHRVLKEPFAVPKGKPDAIPQPVLSSLSIEARLLHHALALHRTLMEVGLDELKELDTKEPDLGQRISAVLRRTLPALRIASKWLKTNYDYVRQGVEGMKAAVTPNEREPTRRRDANITDISIGIPEFWRVYADFTRALSRAFPADRLPPVTGTLQEDVDMRGFLPLVNVMEDHTPKSPQAERSLAEAQVHPNDLQLMRIGDLLADALSLVGIQGIPLTIYGNHIMLKGAAERGSIKDTQSIPLANQSIIESIRDRRAAQIEPDDEVMTEGTDDGVVRDAFKFLDRSEDEDDDEVVYMRVPPSPVITSAKEQQSPRTPVKPSSLPQPMKTPKAAPATTTAQDLLHDLMGQNRTNLKEPPSSPTSALYPLVSSVPGGASIWSASRDEQSLQFKPAVPANSSPYHQTQQSPYGMASSPITQPDWASNGRTFQLPPQPPIMPVGHHRTLTGTLPPQHFMNQSHDVFGYPSPSLQQHVQPMAAPGYPQYFQQHQQPQQQTQLPPPSLAPGTALYQEHSPLTGFHARHMSLHDQPGNQPYMTQVWGTGG